MLGRQWRAIVTHRACVYLQSQVVHLHEVLRYIHLSRCDEQAVARFRLGVKRRLYKKYQDWLAGFEAGEAQKKELADIYQEEVEAVYSAVARKLRLSMPSLGTAGDVPAGV